jgi:hypothetical protein
MALVDTFLLQVVGTLASTATVGLLGWAVSLLRNISETTEENERRSIRNARALQRNDIHRPPAWSDVPENRNGDQRSSD